MGSVIIADGLRHVCAR